MARPEGIEPSTQEFGVLVATLEHAGVYNRGEEFHFLSYATNVGWNQTNCHTAYKC